MITGFTLVCGELGIESIGVEGADGSQGLVLCSLGMRARLCARHTYTGSVIKPEPAVALGSRNLIKGTDYTLAWSNNVNAGTANVTATGKGNYTGTKSATFTIARAKVAVPAATNRTYTDKEQVSVAAGAGYELSCTASATNAGSYTAIATPDANHCWADCTTGPREVRWSIAKAASSIKLADQTVTYTGKAIAYSGEVTRTGSAGGVTLAYYSDASCTQAVAAANVKVTVKQGTKKGTYTIKIKVAAKGNKNYKAGSKTVTCTVVVK